MLSAHFHVRNKIFVPEDNNDYVFQQDGSRANYKDVRGYLNRNLHKGG